MAGVMTIPLIAGLVVSSTVSGQIITRTGRWKAFLVTGGVLLTAGLRPAGHAAVRHRRTGTSRSSWRCIGLGVGMMMQNLVLAVQNQVRAERPRRGQLGRHVLPLPRRRDRRLGARRRPGQPRHRTTSRTAWPSWASKGGTGQRSDGAIPDWPRCPPRSARSWRARTATASATSSCTPRRCALLALIVVLFIKEVAAADLATRRAAPPTPTDAPGGRHRPAPRPSRHAAAAEPSEAGPGRRRPSHEPAGRQPAAADRHSRRALAARRRTAYASAGPPRRSDLRRQPGSAASSAAPTARPVPHAALTLIASRGHQLGRRSPRPTAPTRWPAPGSGTYVLIASADDHEPQARRWSSATSRSTSTSAHRHRAGSPAPCATPTGTPVAERHGHRDRRARRGAWPPADRRRRATSPSAASSPAPTRSRSTPPAYRPAALPVEVRAPGQTRHDVELLPGARVQGTVRRQDARPARRRPGHAARRGRQRGRHRDDRRGRRVRLHRPDRRAVHGHRDAATRRWRRLTLTGRGDDDHDSRRTPYPGERVPGWAARSRVKATLTASGPGPAGRLRTAARIGRKDGWAVQHAVVTVTDMTGNQVLRAEADAEGRSSPPRCAPGVYTVIVDRGRLRARRLHRDRDRLGRRRGRARWCWPGRAARNCRRPARGPIDPAHSKSRRTRPAPRDLQRARPVHRRSPAGSRSAPTPEESSGVEAEIDAAVHRHRQRHARRPPALGRLPRRRRCTRRSPTGAPG